jgi:hypothetical protein
MREGALEPGWKHRNQKVKMHWRLWKEKYYPYDAYLRYELAHNARASESRRLANWGRRQGQRRRTNFARACEPLTGWADYFRHLEREKAHGI